MASTEELEEHLAEAETHVVAAVLMEVPLSIMRALQLLSLHTAEALVVHVLGLLAGVSGLPHQA